MIATRTIISTILFVLSFFLSIGSYIWIMHQDDKFSNFCLILNYISRGVSVLCGLWFYLEMMTLLCGGK